MICVECEPCFSIALNDIYELSPGRGTESGLRVQAGRGTGQLLCRAEPNLLISKTGRSNATGELRQGGPSFHANVTFACLSMQLVAIQYVLCNS